MTDYEYEESDEPYTTIRLSYSPKHFGIRLTELLPDGKVVTGILDEPFGGQLIGRLSAHQRNTRP